MDLQELDKLRFPIGKFAKPDTITNDLISSYINTIGNFPSKIKNEVAKLSDDQLNTPYRPDGWTVRQLVHHCADSHINAFVRFKLALTEEGPTIKPYMEDKWAQMNDYKEPIDSSLKILEGLHYRWSVLLKSMSDADFNRTYIHPEQGKSFELRTVLALYDWHSKHHLAHITELKKRMGW